MRTIHLSVEAKDALAEAAGGRGKIFVPEGKTAAQTIKTIDGFIRRHRDKVMADREAPIGITACGIIMPRRRGVPESPSGRYPGSWGTRGRRSRGST